MRHNQQNRKGFTLVELVVVVLVIGIIAAIAAPKMFDTANDARLNSTVQSLTILRDSIELYRASNGSYPTTQAQIESMLKGPFPKNQIAAAANDASISIVTDGTALSASGAHDWKYDSTSGELIINTTGYDSY